MGNYGILRVEKVKNKLHNVQNHNRASYAYIKMQMESDIEECGHSEIILENHKYNKTLVECDGTYTNAYNKIIAEHGIGSVRKDAVKLLNGVVTLSPESIPHLMVYLHRNDVVWKSKPENADMINAYNSLSQEERTRIVNDEFNYVNNYFNDALEWVKNEYGILINAEIHFHETTPHLHFTSVPIVEREKIVDDKKVTTYALSAKEILGNSKKMSMQQTKFANDVCKKYGLERGEIREGSEAKKHLTKKQKQLADTEKALAENKEKIEQINIQSFQNNVDRIDNAENAKKLAAEREAFEKEKADFEVEREREYKQINEQKSQNKQKAKEVEEKKKSLEQKEKLLNEQQKLNIFELNHLKRLTKELAEEIVRTKSLSNKQIDYFFDEFLASLATGEFTLYPDDPTMAMESKYDAIAMQQYIEKCPEVREKIKEELKKETGLKTYEEFANKNKTNMFYSCKRVYNTIKASAGQVLATIRDAFRTFTQVQEEIQEEYER